VRIVVTGALGHIGSRFIRALPASALNSEITLVDNLSTERYCSLFDLPSTGRYEFHEADVLTADLDAIFAGADVVLHLAAVTDAASSFDHAAHVEQVNLRGTERVARACARQGSALIFISTTSVYGKSEGVVDEDCPEAELQPQSPYADSKLQAEHLLEQLGRTGGLRFVVCRFGTIFGTAIGMRFHTAINKFCWQAALGQPITVWRTALHQKRPYLDLDDAVRALEFIIQRRLFDNRVYNVVTINATVGEIVEIIRQEVPDTHVEFVDSQIMNQLSYTVSAKRFEDLGFRFQGSLEKGIRETLPLLAGARHGAMVRT
jgi:UDP-glucose 4-epimerase